MYTIKKAAQLAGVSVPVMRAWERRYGIVQPERTGAGYRLYDEDAIARVRAMRRLVGEGWSPSAAAGSLRRASEEVIQGLAEGRNGGGDAVDQQPAREGADLTQAFLAGAAALDGPAIESALDEMFARGTFERVVQEHVFPALVALGEAWAEGRLDVAQEHAASAAVLRRLGEAFSAAGAGRPTGGRRVLVGLPPGARHELGALTFATALRRAGLEVVYLGPDLPLTDWVEAASSDAVVGIVIGAVAPEDAAGTESVVSAVRAARLGVAVFVGGRQAPPGRRADRIVLPEDLVAAVDVVRRTLDGGTAGRQSAERSTLAAPARPGR